MIGTILTKVLLYVTLITNLQPIVSFIDSTYDQTVKTILSILGPGSSTDSQAADGKDAAQNPDNAPANYVEVLKELGFYKPESEEEALNLRNTFLRFQAAHNLVVDGIWGEQSQAGLNKRVKAQSFSYPDTVDTPPTIGKWIAINKSNRILTLYENRAVVKKYPVAIGYPSNLTPDGKFTIVIKVVNPAWGGGGYAKPVEGGSPSNPLGYRWMGLSLKGGGEYGIHGNNAPYSIGTDASHGCVRMINSDVEELFEIVPTTTPVWIGPDQTLRIWGIGQEDYSK